MQWDSRMHIVITDGFVKGYYFNTRFSGPVNVIGAVIRNEMILIESENGKITRTFQGKFQKKSKGVMLLSGIWKSINNTVFASFTDPEIMPDKNQTQAFYLISKKQ